MKHNVLVPAGPPSKPSVEAIDEKSVTLAWKAPTDDGGDKISAYVIEKKPEGSDDWLEVMTSPASRETHATVTQVRKDERCQFRVRAVNKAGSGEPSGPTDVVT